MKQFAKLVIGMCLLFAGSQFAVAGVNLTPSVLNNAVTPSCYSYRTHTVPTSPLPFAGNGQEMVGVMCFHYVTGPTGSVTDGHFRDAANITRTTFTCLPPTNTVTGTYGEAPSNLPYYGGGWIKLTGAPTWCQNDYDIIVNNVSGGLAGGFQLIKRTVTPDPAAFVLGGTAFYQGPQPPAPGYYSPVLSGCYSFLSESVLSSSTPSGPGKDLLGTICFSPGGIASPSGNLTFGRTRDLNGVITSINNPNGSCASCIGTYVVTNSPGWGMGTFSVGGLIFDFAPFGVGIPAPGVAAGFHFTLNTPASPAGSRLEGGTAYFQQP